MGRKIRIIDSTLRDGMHAVSHQFSPQDMAEIAQKLDEAGVDTIEIGHGDGLGGSSFQYGFSAYSDEEYLQAVSGVLKKAKLDVLLIPGIGIKEDLEMAAKHGAKVVRVATHVTEADIGEQHIKLAKELGMEAVGFLMMSHMADVSKIVEQAKLFASYGADIIYVTDSAGALTPQGVFERVKAVKEATGLTVGHHAHNNLGLAVANTLAAIEAGADVVDGTCKGLGAGAGNTQIEVLIAVLNKLGYETGVDLYKIMDVADDVVGPKMQRPQVIDKNSLTIGYAGVYGSFLLHALRAAEKFDVDARDILYEMGNRKTVGGQEDIIVDVAYELSKKKSLA
ncbi:MAG: 4-hydroxy 2-oxovalerate aldolase [Clostridia bacterium]|jgi:4-hydroxy 2-oxovalerate aldolase|nr:4-hydroxy 2-oxovalerate aldolase [Clostridia bacterium]